MPVASLNLISRYSGGAEESAPLHKLGGEAWAKARRRAAEKVRDVAAELLDVYAKRELNQGINLRSIATNTPHLRPVSHLRKPTTNPWQSTP